MDFATPCIWCSHLAPVFACARRLVLWHQTTHGPGEANCWFLSTLQPRIDRLCDSLRTLSRDKMSRSSIDKMSRRKDRECHCRHPVWPLQSPARVFRPPLHILWPPGGIQWRAVHPTNVGAEHVWGSGGNTACRCHMHRNGEGRTHQRRGARNPQLADHSRRCSAR